MANTAQNSNKKPTKKPTIYEFYNKKKKKKEKGKKKLIS